MASVNDEADIDDTPTTGNPQIDGLLTQYHWSLFARDTFEFTIPDSETDYEDTRDFLIDDYPDDNHEFVTAMPGFMVDAIRFAIAHYNTILNFEITENADNNADTELRYGLITNDSGDDPDAPAYAWVPQDDGEVGEQDNWKSGDMFYNQSDFGTVGLIAGTPAASMIGTYQYHTILHETGHALGLKHGHTADHGNPALPTAWDSMEFTVMTYRGFVGDRPGGGYQVADGHYAQTLMMLDIQALQHIYGADFTTQSTNTVYRWDTQGRYFIDGALQWNTDTDVIFMTVWDGGGADTYDFSAFASDATIDLSPGGWTDLDTQLAQLGPNAADPTQIARGNVFNALQFNGDSRSLIENAIGGSGNDTMTGNDAFNKLTGNQGADTLNGLAGNDTLTGDAGEDALFGGAGLDTLNGGAGGDTLDGGADFDTVLYNEPGGVTVTITPVGAAGAGRWSVAGPAQAGGDTLRGIESFVFGTGNDTITLGNGTGDTALWIDAAAGNDTITGSAGATDKDFLIGGAGSDRLEVRAGSFEVYGGRSNGLDWIESARDNDLLVIDRSSFGASYTLFWLSEGLALGKFFGFADDSQARGIARIHYTGSDFTDLVDGGVRNDILLGGNGNDSLSGRKGNDELRGGGGVDSLDGGDGNDILIGNAGDNTLFGGAGDDVITSPGAAALGGLGNDIIRGGNFDERFEGNENNDRLSGAGGTDQLVGGTGNDFINGGAGADFLDGGEDVDELSYAGSAQRVVVNLETAAASGGDAAGDSFAGFENLQGSSFNDVLVGDAGRNSLWGELGDDRLTGSGGNDRLTGGGGADEYCYVDQQFGQDTIAGFEDGLDKIDLRGSGLTFSSFTESQVGSAVVLTLLSNANHAITLLGMSISDISAGDFIV